MVKCGMGNAECCRCSGSRLITETWRMEELNRVFLWIRRRGKSETLQSGRARCTVRVGSQGSVYYRLRTVLLCF